MPEFYAYRKLEQQAVPHSYILYNVFKAKAFFNLDTMSLRR